MDVKEFLEKIKVELLYELNKSTEEQKAIEEEEEKRTKKSKTIDKFLSKYKKEKIIDLDLIRSYFNEISSAPIEKYEGQLKYLEFCKTTTRNMETNPSLIAEDINKIMKQIDNLIKEVNSYYNKVISNFKKDGFKKRILINTIKENKEILNIIEKIYKEKLLTQDEFKLLTEYVRNDEKKFTDAEKLQIIEFLFKYNTTIIIEKINQELLKQQQEAKEKEKAAKIKEKVKKKKKTKKQAEKKEIIKEEPKQEEKRPLLSNKQDMLLQHAKEIAKEIKENYPEMPAALNAIKMNQPFEKRDLIYKNPKDIEEQLVIIGYDLFTNVIPKIEKKLTYGFVDEELFNLLEKIINTYKEIEEKIKKEYQEEESKEKKYIDYLIKNNMTEEYQLFQNVVELITELTNLMTFTTDPVKKYELNEKIERLTECKEYYIHCMNEYESEQTEDNKEIMIMQYNELEKCYKEVIEEYQKEENPEYMKEQIIKKGESFYEGASNISNFFIFLNGDKDTESSIERDIRKDPKIPRKVYEQALSVLHTKIYEQLITSNNHKSKSSNYSKEYLKKNPTRSIKCGDYRIFYCILDAKNLAEVFPKGTLCPKNVALIISIGYGATDKEDKSEIYEEAIKRGYDNKEEISKIEKLLTEDLTKLSKEEKEQRIKEIQSLLERNYLKLGSLITASEKLKKKDGRSKTTKGGETDE